mgnify:CR=1 FL=1
MADLQFTKNLTPTVTVAISGAPDYEATYGAGTAYTTGDVVSYNGSSYVARQSTTGNTPGDTAYWQTLASKGNDGAAGPAGAGGVVQTVTAGTNLNGGGSATSVTLNLDSAISLTSATLSAASPLIFEGATADAHETTIAVTDPTADRTVTIPDGSGTIAYLDSNITGNAATATSATTATNVTATANNSTDETVYLTFVDGATGSQGVETDTGLNYNPSSGVLTTTSVTGNLTGNVTGNVSGSSGSATGNAATATEATNITATANNSTDETVYLTFVDGATGTQGIETDTGLSYNPSSGVLTTTSVTGNLTGNVTGDVSGSSGSSTGNAATATTATNVTATANNSTDETVYLTFVDGATGSQGIETDTGLSYNPSSGVLTTTSVTGNLTGNVTGNTSGSSGSTTGNAATATALETARTIGGVSFNGTANINLAGVNTAGNQDTSGNASTATEATNVTATANNSTDETVYLTFVDGATGTQGIETDTGLSYNPSSGVLTTTSVTGNLTGNVTGNVSGSSGSTTGNAATATALATARDINGVSFDGTGNITVTAAAGTLSGTELKSTVVTSSLTSVGTLSALIVSGTVTIDSVGITAVQTSAESFADNDTSLMTSAAIDDRINAASGATAGGSNTQVQYNSSGSFAGSSNLTFNGTTLTANAFSGPLTGNVTGNVSGTAATVTGAAQSNITSVGTLTGLTVGGTAFINSDQDITDFTDDTRGNLTLYNSDGAVDDFTCLDFDGNSTDPAARIGMKYTSAGSELHFGTSNSYAAGITHDGLVIGPTGKVAIGDTSAMRNLDVVDDIMIHHTDDDHAWLWSVDTSGNCEWWYQSTYSSGDSGWSQKINLDGDGSTDLTLKGGTGTGYTHTSIMHEVTDDGRGAGTYSWNGYNDTTWFWGNPYGYEDSFRVCREASTTSLDVSAAHGGTYKLMRVMSDGDVTIEGTLTENSDSRLKREIVDSSLGLNFVNALQPREYRRVDGVRKHYGFIAQEVAAVLPDASDNAIWVNDQENVADIGEEENIVSTQGLRYTHLIAPLVKAVQELSAKVTALEG